MPMSICSNDCVCQGPSCEPIFVGADQRPSDLRVVKAGQLPMKDLDSLVSSRASDGVCDDGLDGAHTRLCDGGHDCDDCGVRIYQPSPPAPPLQPPPPYPFPPPSPPPSPRPPSSPPPAVPMPSIPPSPPPTRPYRIVLPHLLTRHEHDSAGGAVRVTPPKPSASGRAPPGPKEPADGGSGSWMLAAAAGLLMSVATLVLLGLCVLREHRRSTGQLYDGLSAGETPCFETHVYIEDGEMTCDFLMRLELAELSSRDLLLECIARAAFEATDISFDFASAQLARVDQSGRVSAVKTDTDTRRIRERPDSAAALRVVSQSPVLRRGGAARTAPSRLDGAMMPAAQEWDEEHELVL